MTLTTTAALVGAAYEAGRGVAAFNAINLETVEAIAAGAETANRPVIVQISENAVRYHNQAAIAVASNAAMPISLHLDHATDERLVGIAVDLGFSSVMYDASQLTYEENLAPPPPSPDAATTAAPTSRPSSARSAARAASTHPAYAPTRTRRPPSSPAPGSTLSPSRSARATR